MAKSMFEKTDIFKTKYSVTTIIHQMLDTRTTQNDRINQEKLLVARNMQQCMKIRSRMPGISTEQGTTHKENSTFTSLTYTKNTMRRNQY